MATRILDMPFFKSSTVEPSAPWLPLFCGIDGSFNTGLAPMGDAAEPDIAESL